MIKRKNESGSAHVIIIAALVVVIFGLLGFVFWQNFIYKEPATPNVETVNVNQKNVETKKIEPQLFAIDEYQSEFEMPDRLKNTTIKFEKRQIGEGTFLAFTTQRVIDLGGDCAKGYPFGDIVRITRNNSAASTDIDVYTTQEIKGYYYHISTVDSSGLVPKSTCLDNEVAVSDMNSLVGALKGLKAKE